MSSILENVDRRTKLAGENRLEVLLFCLESEQTYGINVFKVREVIRRLPLTKVPKSNDKIRGISSIRGQTIPVIDLSMAIGGKPVEDPNSGFIIITEYNQTVQGFLVGSVNKIINTNWDSIHPPPNGSGPNCYLTSVTNHEDKLVEIIDVEKVLQEISPQSVAIDPEIKNNKCFEEADKYTVLICDDSSVARKQLIRVLTELNLNVVSKKNGREAYDHLLASVHDGRLSDKIVMLISDIEMPEMDGYKLTTLIRKDPALKDLFVVLHTSLSGVFNNALIEKVGANCFIPKFKANGIATIIKKALESAIKKNAN